MPEPQRSHGWWPYVVPYVVFLLLVELGGRLPEPWGDWLLPVKVVVPGGLFLAYALAGRYPELRGYRPGAAWLAADVAVGLLVVAIWMGPFVLFDSLSAGAPEDAFDPESWGHGLREAKLGVRLLGFAAVTPFVEELFVRSFLIRLVDVIDEGHDFRRVPIGRFAWRSFVVTVVWFTFSHVPWEWGVAAVTGVVWNLWLYRRGHIGATIVSHAVANGTIWAIVVFGPGGLWNFL